MENAMVKRDDFTDVFMDEGEKIISDITSKATFFCSLKAETLEEKAVLYTVMNNPEKRLGDCINMTLNIKDVFVEVVKLTNADGVESLQPRVVLVDDKNVGYQCVSTGVFSALRKLIAVYGEPTWKSPLPLKVVQVTKNERKMLTLDVNYK